MLSIYRASAGSGKTFTLARDYICMLLSAPDFSEKSASAPATPKLNFNPKTGRLLQHDRHQHILAITFTKKATEEMKTRIVNELDKLSKLQEDSLYRTYFKKEYGWDETQQAKAASLAMSELLFDYHHFNISTIDSFFQRVVHTFARELDKQNDYEVELDIKNAIKLATGDMLDDFNSSSEGSEEFKNLEKWIIDFIQEHKDTQKKSNFFNRNSNLYENQINSMTNIEKEAFAEYSQSMKKYLEGNKLEEYVKELNEYIKTTVKELAKECLENGNDTLIESLKKSSIPYKLFSRLREFGLILKENPTAEIEYSLISYLCKNASNDGFRKIGNGEFKNQLAARVSLSPEGENQLSDLANFFRERILVRLITALEIKKSLSFLGLLAYTWKYLDKNTKENNILLISDTNTLVKQIIGKDETPFVYERMGVRLNHFLIDEFQDTSKMQWDNLKPLLSNGLGDGFDSLIIGDEKQSIYRFRNSDSNILHNQVGAEFEKFINKNVEKGKNTNYRSAKEIVEFNNDLFSRLAEALGVSGYENVEQEVSSQELGYVRLEQTNGNEGKKDEYAEAVLHEMAEAIIKQHNEQGYPWNKIVVLVNKNDEARQVATYILNNYEGKINMLSDEALLISTSRAVRLVVSALKILDTLDSSPEGTKHYLSQEKTGIVIQNYHYLLNEAIIALSHERGAALEEEEIREVAQRMMHRATANKGAETINTIEELQKLKPSSLIAQVEFIIGKLLTEDERRLQLAYLAAFQDKVVDFCSRTNGSLHAFMEWWTENENSLNISGAEESDAIRVMTIHKAKGLEFECVHIPFCIWDLNGFNHRPSLWVKCPSLPALKTSNAPAVIFINLKRDHENELSPFKSVFTREKRAALQDAMNKTYVAFTRACTELRIWFYTSKDNIGDHMLPIISRSEHICPEDQNSPVEVSEKTKGIDESYSYKTVNVFTAGEPTTYKPKTKTNKYKIGESIDLQYPVNPTVRANAVLQVVSALDSDSNICEETEASEEAATEEIRIQGLQLHSIMSKIRNSTDVSNALSSFQKYAALPEEKFTEYSNLVRTIVDGSKEEGYDWFKKGVKCYIERSIVIPSADKVKRPDRIVEYPDGTMDVIDFKFTPDANHIGIDEHITQVQEYMSLLFDMGYRKIRGFLCYPHFSKIEPVPLTLRN